MMKRWWIAGALLHAGIAVWGCGTQAQPRPDRPLDRQPATFAVGVADYRVERFVLPSAIPGKGYRIQVWRPLAPPPPGGYPTLYMLDGNAVFESLVQTGREQGVSRAVPALIVGIGYDVDDRFDVDARSYDYTPPSPGDDSPIGMPNNPQARGRPGGGGDRFLDFIEHDLKPVIAARFPVDPAKQGLYGHSFGGLLVLHALFTRPQAFRTYVAASPSIWWNNRFILSEAKTFVERGWQGPTRRLLVMAGEKEVASQIAETKPEKLVSDLLRAEGIVAEYREFAGLGHGEMLPASLGPGLFFSTAR